MKTTQTIIAVFIFALLLTTGPDLLASTGHSVQLQQDSVRVTFMASAKDGSVWGVATSTYSVTPASSPSYEVVRSTDGGNTWQDFVTPVTTSPDSEFFANIFALDSLHCWISFTFFSGYNGSVNGPAAGVFATSDGGNTWVYQDSSAFSQGDIDFVYFFTPDSGLAVGDPYQSFYFNIWVTTNGGTTWTAISQSNIPVCDTAFGISEEAAFSGAFNVYNGSFNFPTSINRYFTTTDWGYTWTVDSLGAFEPTYNYPIISNNAGVLFQSINDLDTVNYLYSTNNGQSVTMGYPADSGVYTQIGNYSYIGSGAIGTDFFAIGYTSNNEEYLLRSTAGLSQTWQVVDSIANNAWLFSSLPNQAVFYSNNVGWIPGTIVNANNVQQIYTFSDCSFASPPSFNGLPDTLCSNANAVVLNQASPAGGSYYINGIADTVINPLALGPGNDTILYNYMDSVGCRSSAEAAVTISICTGIEAINETSLNLYPNPASSQLILSSNYPLSNENKPVVYDALGRMVSISYQVGANTLTFNTAGLTAGFYYMQITTKGQTYTFKFIKSD